MNNHRDSIIDKNVVCTFFSIPVYSTRKIKNLKTTTSVEGSNSKKNFIRCLCYLVHILIIYNNMDRTEYSCSTKCINFVERTINSSETSLSISYQGCIVLAKDTHKQEQNITISFVKVLNFSNYLTNAKTLLKCKVTTFL